MSNREISLWKVEEFLISNLKQIPLENDRFKLETDCSIKEFLEKFENYIIGG